MATQKQIDANRRNAQKSTGPRTPEGKAVTALNAVKHGLHAKTVVLDCKLHRESVAAFKALYDALTDRLDPQTDFEKYLVRDLAVTRWKLERAQRMERLLTAQSATINREAAPTLATVLKIRERLSLRLSQTLTLYRHFRWFDSLADIACDPSADEFHADSSDVDLDSLGFDGETLPSPAPEPSRRRATKPSRR